MKNESDPKFTIEEIKNSIRNIRPLSNEEKEFIKAMAEEDKIHLLLFYDKIVQKLVKIMFEV
jgi:hypothetical protein